MERNSLLDEVDLLKDQMRKKEGFNQNLGSEIEELQNMLKQAHAESKIIT